MHAFDRRTDGRMDRILIARPRLHFMQRSKNYAATPVVSLFLAKVDDNNTVYTEL